MDRLNALLAAAHDPVHPGRAQAEAELQQLQRDPEALDWALSALQAPPGAPLDAAIRFYACSVAEAAVARRWVRLPADQQAAVRTALWQAAVDPAAPHFQRSKLAAALAHAAALDAADAWPQFLSNLSACLADEARREAGVDLLGTAVEHFHSLAQATSVGLRGKVPSAALPAIQQRYRELQPLAAATLCSLLQQLRASLPQALAGGGSSGAAAAGLLSLAGKALRGLRATLADANRLPEQQGMSSAAVVDLLFAFVAAAQLAPRGSGSEEAAVAVAAAALDCTADLCSKFLGGAEASNQMLEVLLPKLQETCVLVQRRWAHAGGGLDPEDPLLTAFVRLLVQFFSTQLSNAEATPQLAAQVRGLLAAVVGLSTVRRSPVDLLLFLEVWHAVLGYISGFEEQLWELEDDPAAAGRIKAAVAAYKELVIAAADLVLSTLSLGGPAAAPPPFVVGALSSAPGSGSAMEDWLASVVAGGDGGMEGESQAEAAAAQGDEEGEEEDELLVPGAAAGSRALQADSEQDVYVRHAESFLAQAMGTFSSELLPRVLLQLQACSGSFAAACDAAAARVQAAAAAAGQQQQAAPSLDDQLPAFRGMDVCLRLLMRCGPLFPTRGAAEPAAPLADNEGMGPISGAHAVQTLRGLCQLAAAWLRSVQAMAAATAAQQAAQPSTPAHAAGGGGASLHAMLLAGGRLHKAIGSLTATFLSQLVMALVHGTADPDAAAVAQELVLCVLSSAAGLQQALVSPAMDLGWRPLLHRAAVWGAESLVSLSSIALSSALKPPPALLGALWSSQQAQVLLRAYHAALTNPALLPLRASRALGLSLSDLALRSWPAQPAAQFDASARSSAFASVAAPLLQLLQAAAATPGAAPAGVVQQAAGVATTIVQSYAGSPKPLRSIVASALVSPVLPAAVELVRAERASGNSKAAAALLRLLTCSLEVLPTELGSETVEQLLGALVQAFAAAGGDPTFESDLLMTRLLTLVLSQGSAHKHRTLLQPALQYMAGVYARASSPQAAAAAVDADLAHVRAASLAGLLSALRFKWQALAGSSVKPAMAADAAAAAGAAGGAAHPLAASLQQHAAAGGASGQQQAAAGEGPGAAAITQVLQLLVQFFTSAAAMQPLLAAADVRLVLEELYELQVATKLYSLPLFRPAWAPLTEALLAMLLSRLYTAAQDDLSDSLFALAAANWTEFLLGLLPRFVDGWLPGLGGSERAVLLSTLGQSDLDAHAFETKLRLLVNDAVFFEAANS
ncbi:Tubulin-folding cofactor B [Chlorella sorokiniana]|uniref:Tubulin-folding cofactor B n=1 Tax=Chlorella sorokiniana TaxID=3076 RepID=A0A2P6U400_CHLSO|nr:Tubulin-folding cofactor B [Chlorella sorokiniana]|eukprot:PRW61041.1 Tubulin-folding cofactor B [Chlorella sorokiniana]